MTVPLQIYIAAYSLAMVIAIAILISRRSEIVVCGRAYWRVLATPWKLATFMISATGLIVIAPYSGDPTWDYVDAAFMSVLAFATAPWTVGALYLRLRGRAGWRETYVAVCVWLFAASWSYDLYILFRDGVYPITWLPNLFASSVLYVSAGLFWNLEWRANRGVHFGFTEKNWPESVTIARGARVFWYALPFAILVGAMILPFLWEFMQSR